ncbi:hypothetical protein FKM82_005407 [Ascaphus truei]
MLELYPLLCNILNNLFGNGHNNQPCICFCSHVFFFHHFTKERFIFLTVCLFLGKLHYGFIIKCHNCEVLIVFFFLILVFTFCDPLYL